MEIIKMEELEVTLNFLKDGLPHLLFNMWIHIQVRTGSKNAVLWLVEVPHNIYFHAASQVKVNFY